MSFEILQDLELALLSQPQLLDYMDYLSLLPYDDGHWVEARGTAWAYCNHNDRDGKTLLDIANGSDYLKCPICFKAVVYGPSPLRMRQLERRMNIDIKGIEVRTIQENKNGV